MESRTKRNLLLIVALPLAVVSALGWTVYTSDFRSPGCDSAAGVLPTTCIEPIQVVVANRDIPPNTPLDPLIADNSFRNIPVLPEALVAGAVIEIDQLRGKASTALILQNEQIPMERLTEECPRKEPATPIVCVFGSP